MPLPMPFLIFLGNSKGRIVLLHGVGDPIEEINAEPVFARLRH